MYVCVLPRPGHLPRGRWSLKVLLLQMAEKRLIKIQKPYQPHSPQTLLQLLLRLSLPQDALQPADQLGSKPFRLHVDILWNPVRALRGETSNCKPPDFLSAPTARSGDFTPPPLPPGMKRVSVEHRHNPFSRTQTALVRVAKAPACGRLLPPSRERGASNPPPTPRALPLPPLKEKKSMTGTTRRPRNDH